MPPPPVHLREFARVVFFTGAGMSAESGVPTYRGRGGVWSQYRYEEYACQAAFDRNPARVWEFHQQRRSKVASCQPHSGHRRLAELEAELPGLSIVTQNIDGLHQRAGSTRVLELHGSLWRLRCDPCNVVAANHDVPLASVRHGCGRHWRPDIVWFGDALVDEVVQAAVDAIAACDLLVSVGTSGVVYPAAQLPALARERGATLIEINPEPTPLSHLFDHCLRGPASEWIERLGS